MAADCTTWLVATTVLPSLAAAVLADPFANASTTYSPGDSSNGGIQSMPYKISPFDKIRNVD